jgi:ArsR family transcriptional regulator, cadmium/lead-responsive transcriptional repressor
MKARSMIEHPRLPETDTRRLRTEAAGSVDDGDPARIEAADLSARFFRVLGDPTRVRLLHLLLDIPAGECNVGDLVTALGVPQSRISTHLACLRWCGLVQARREGKQVYYRVADARVRELLSLGSAMVRDHAAEVASCDVIR